MSTEITQYSTTTPFVRTMPIWAGIENQERLGAYTAFENMYWSEKTAFKLIRRNDDGDPLYIPRPKMIVDTTAHYLLKGMKVTTANPEGDTDFMTFLDDWCNRERFYSKFETAKLAGVVRGDMVLHITANPRKDEGTRVSFNSVDPASYFPDYDTDDLEKRTGVRLVEQWVDPDDPTITLVKVLRYWQEYDEAGNKVSPLVWREENLWEIKDWWNPAKAVKKKTIIPASTLPSSITAIPVYHFKNAEWDGYQFGNSELKGYERVFAAINQAMSDEEIALALTGLGVYATDAGRPKDSQGNETDWIVAPGTVWEMPGATMVKRLEGITSVTPVLDHVNYLEDALLGASGTSKVALGDIDTQTAESGIALALKFLPTLAKIEYRDQAGVELLTQFWYDWKFWVLAYENLDFTGIKIVIKLGNKLPLNRPKIIEELNNLFDRGIISAQFYRDELARLLEYTFPKTIAQDIIDEKVALAKAMAEAIPAPKPDPELTGPGGRKVGAGDTFSRADRNKSNNRERTNESGGTEVKSK